MDEGRAALATMQASPLCLTMNIYTDPSLLDVAGALAALPELSLKREAQAGPKKAVQQVARPAGRAGLASRTDPFASHELSSGAIG